MKRQVRDKGWMKKEVKEAISDVLKPGVLVVTKGLGAGAGQAEAA